MANEERDRCIEFGRRLRELRRKRGIAQELLAQMAGLDRNYVTEAERGKANPSLETIGSLAEALDVDDVALISDDGLAAALRKVRPTNP